MELVIIGGGVSGRAAEKLGKKLGYTCTVVDNKLHSNIPLFFSFAGADEKIPDDL